MSCITFTIQLTKLTIISVCIVNVCWSALGMNWLKWAVEEECHLETDRKTNFSICGWSLIWLSAGQVNFYLLCGIAFIVPSTRTNSCFAFIFLIPEIINNISIIIIHEVSGHYWLYYCYHIATVFYLLIQDFMHTRYSLNPMFLLSFQTWWYFLMKQHLTVTLSEITSNLATVTWWLFQLNMLSLQEMQANVLIASVPSCLNVICCFPLNFQAAIV